MPDDPHAGASATFAAVWRQLRDAGYPPPYLLIDCAGVDGGRARLPWKAFAEAECLFTGDLAVELADVGPYLARFKGYDAGSEEIARHLLETHAGLLAVLPAGTAAAADGAPVGAPVGASIDFAPLHRHFRKFNVVYDPAGKPLFFRYYDPRVIVDVLAVLTPEQLDAFFGPVESFVLVDAARKVVRYRSQAGQLALVR